MSGWSQQPLWFLRSTELYYAVRDADVRLLCPGPSEEALADSMTGCSFAKATSTTFLNASISSSTVPPKPVLAKLIELPT